jgi:hypothetical protein
MLLPITIRDAASSPAHRPIRAARCWYAATSRPKLDLRYETRRTMLVKNPAHLASEEGERGSEQRETSVVRRRRRIQRRAKGASSS